MLVRKAVLELSVGEDHVDDATMSYTYTKLYNDCRVKGYSNAAGYELSGSKDQKMDEPRPDLWRF